MSIRQSFQSADTKVPKNRLHAVLAVGMHGRVTTGALWGRKLVEWREAMDAQKARGIVWAKDSSDEEDEEDDEDLEGLGAAENADSRKRRNEQVTPVRVLNNPNDRGLCRHGLSLKALGDLEESKGKQRTVKMDGDLQKYSKFLPKTIEEWATVFWGARTFKILWEREFNRTRLQSLAKQQPDTLAYNHYAFMMQQSDEPFLKDGFKDLFCEFSLPAIRRFAVAHEKKADELHWNTIVEDKFYPQGEASSTQRRPGMEELEETLEKTYKDLLSNTKKSGTKFRGFTRETIINNITKTMISLGVTYDAQDDVIKRVFEPGLEFRVIQTFIDSKKARNGLKLSLDIGNKSCEGYAINVPSLFYMKARVVNPNWAPNWAPNPSELNKEDVQNITVSISNGDPWSWSKD
jgi:hypothetical protein